jgi:hypothetical protein
MPLLQHVGLAMACLGGLFALLNWWTIVQTWRTGRFCSPVPLIGPAFLIAGMLLIPGTRPYAWVAVIADYGTLAFLIAIPLIIKEVWSTSRYCLLEEYVGDRDGKTVYLRLFRKGVFTIKQHIRRPVGEHGVVQAGTIGEWEREGERLVLRLDGQSAEFETVAHSEPKALHQVVGFPSYERDRDLSLAGVELTIHYRRGQTSGSS